MRNKYIDLIDQTFEWPQENFDLDEDNLVWNGIHLMDIIKQYGTPLKISYLPKITENIQKAKRMFNVAMAKVDYEGEYHYCYCTKSSHFRFVLEEALKNGIHLETSSAFDVNLIESLYEDGLITKNQFIVSNGFKRRQYIINLARLINNDFVNTIPVFDNYNEVDELSALLKKPCKVGIRIAAEEEPKFEFYTSRLGLGYKDIVQFYKDKIQKHELLELKMLHFFINTGINDTAYYWSELMKCVTVYTELKKICPSLDSLNIGGGFPIKNSLQFDYDYDYMAEEIISQVKLMCNQKGVPEPDIFTEFGSYTVAESGASLFSILDQKKQNDREKWNMIDGSFMTSLPDTWAINKRFILLAINRWTKPYERILLGGLTCDSDDYYNSEQHANAIYLPEYDPEDVQYIGFFHTGAYQESLGGYGGIQHCLIPSPKHVVIDRDETGEIFTRLFAKEQSYKSMMKILGY